MTVVLNSTEQRGPTQRRTIIVSLVSALQSHCLRIGELSLLSLHYQLPVSLSLDVSILSQTWKIAVQVNVHWCVSVHYFQAFAIANACTYTQSNTHIQTPVSPEPCPCLFSDPRRCRGEVGTVRAYSIFASFPGPLDSSSESLSSWSHGRLTVSHSHLAENRKE